jgi:hypothetical protein
MSGRQIYVRVLYNFRFETLGMVKPNLPFACWCLDSEATWINFGMIDELAAKRAWGQ